MNHFRFILPFLFIGVLVLPAQAQQYTRQEAEVIMGGPLHDIIPCPGGDHLVITYPLVEDNDINIALTRFAPQLSMRYNNPLKELLHFHYRGALYSDNRLFLFCNDKQGAVSRYEVDDKTGQVTGRPLALYSLVGKEEEASFYTGSSHDRNFHYCLVKNIGRKESGVTVQGVVLDKKMDLVAHFSFTTPEDKENYKNLEVVLSDKGILSMVYGVSAKTKRSEYIPNKYTLVQVDEKGRTTATPLSGLPVGEISDLSWSMQGDQIIFTGLLSPNGKGFTAIVCGHFDPVSKKITDVRQTEINTLTSNSPGFNKVTGGHGVDPLAKISQSLLLPDGSRIIVLEELYSGYEQEGYYGGVYTPVHINSTGKYFRYNAYVLKVDHQNTPLWLDVVSKSQIEVDMTLRIGIASVADDKGNLHLFFYDSQKDTEPDAASVKEVSTTRRDYESNYMACVSFTPEGKMKKQFLGKCADYEFQPQPENSLSGVGNELYFMAVKDARGFTGAHILHHADFHFGAISIKN
jgi:hypothetical protein